MYYIATVGLHKILSLLEADDADVRIHAVKVVANLAAEGANLKLLSPTFYYFPHCFICVRVQQYLVTFIRFTRNGVLGAFSTRTI